MSLFYDFNKIDNLVELEQRNIPHLIFQPHSLEDIAADLLRLGEALGQKERTKAVVDRYREVIAQYTQLAKKIEQPPTIYWEWWPKPVFTPGKTNWLSEISELAGGRNLFIDIEQANVQTDWEDVKQRNPDHIALAWVGVRSEKIDPAIVKKRPGWNELQAVQSNRIYVLEEALFCRPSPRLLLGLKKLASLLHPDLFPAYDGIDPLLSEAEATEA
ncbi:ABC transporter substrate-binding protein [Anoxybacillus sp. J5B_2022]|uniref:ABC transporter substrate-binding protein n=1 Tax=Anoxybacillus sp. J5B_2022 TaxID=3003246 RepID=UPI002285994B|nr:ABC transporter substrate-binding protein [Anoxybacillus sp. J5B_2022]MCZ0757050.1 ABC transporter substrate-binding protein [Anoxybacillus sp. J5B_2022]